MDLPLRPFHLRKEEQCIAIRRIHEAVSDLAVWKEQRRGTVDFMRTTLLRESFERGDSPVGLRNEELSDLGRIHASRDAQMAETRSRDLEDLREILGGVDPERLAAVLSIPWPAPGCWVYTPGPIEHPQALPVGIKKSIRRLLAKNTRLNNFAIRLYLMAIRRDDLLRRHSLRERENSIFVEEWELPMCSLFPGSALEFVLGRFAPRSVLDVGCGTGAALAMFVDRGMDAVGIEGSELAISRNPNRDRVRRHDLEFPLDLGRRFDLVWSFEVAEHLRADKAETFVGSLTRHSDLVVVSAAPPGQGGEGHFNEQAPEYWISLFEAQGFGLLREETETLRAMAGSPEVDDHSRSLAGNFLVLARKS